MRRSGDIYFLNETSACGSGSIQLASALHFLLKCLYQARKVSTGVDPGVAHPARASLKLEKIWSFGVKSWFFTRNTPTIVAPPSARCNFLSAPPSLDILDPPLEQLYICALGVSILDLFLQFFYGMLELFRQCGIFVCLSIYYQSLITKIVSRRRTKQWRCYCCLYLAIVSSLLCVPLIVRDNVLFYILKWRTFNNPDWFDHNIRNDKRPKGSDECYYTVRSNDL